jgi:hypothetical protein
VGLGVGSVNGSSSAAASVAHARVTRHANACQRVRRLLFIRVFYATFDNHDYAVPAAIRGLTENGGQSRKLVSDTIFLEAA